MEFGEFTELCAMNRRRELERSDLENVRFGLIASAIYNTNRQKESDKVWKPSDFFRPLSYQEEPTQTETTENYDRGFASAFDDARVGMKSAARLKRGKT